MTPAAESPQQNIQPLGDMDRVAEQLLHVVNEGILRGISVAFDHRCYGSAVILIYAAIDAMAFLAMPDGQEDVKRADFVNWVDSYIQFQSQHRVTGLELYGARCAMLHTYGVHSQLSRRRKVRLIGYVDEAQQDVMVDVTGQSTLVLMSIRGFACALAKGIEQFIDSVWRDEIRMNTIVKRLRLVVQCTTLPESLKHL